MLEKRRFPWLAASYIGFPVGLLAVIVVRSLL